MLDVRKVIFWIFLAIFVIYFAATSSVPFLPHFNGGATTKVDLLPSKPLDPGVLHIVAFIGTRPEAIKMAPVIWRLKKESTSALKVTVVDTGQHKQMLQPLLKLFEINPDTSLNVMVQSQSLAGLSSRLLTAIELALQKLNPHLILVQGDTTTVLMAGLAAFYLRIPIGHVKAGLRTYHLYSPFPEEANRHMVSIITAFHFTPTNRSYHVLINEGVPKANVLLTGNTVIDTVQWMLNRTAPSHPVLQIVNGSRRTVLITSHRRENFGRAQHGLFGQMRKLATDFPETLFVFPVHLNPVVQAAAQEVLSGLDNLQLIEPITYEVFIHLLRRVSLILTDSGGIQEEASFLGVPALVMRSNTERPEGVTAGVSKLVKVDGLYAEASILLGNPTAYSKMARKVTVYGDGHAAERIAQHILTNRKLLLSRSMWTHGTYDDAIKETSKSNSVVAVDTKPK